ncbi:MAG: NAD(+)--dinitrogen-reductase ADP-D-ribosyltransferase [Motiliproteus sp.]
MPPKPLPTCSLPRGSYLPINRCNLPAVILGGLTFQQQPAPLLIDGVADLYKDLFQRLGRLPDQAQRAQQFCDYVDVHFCLDDPAAAGYSPGGEGRPKANWQRAIRGWFFDSDSREGAVLKAWVESRFGLLTRFHQGPIRDFNGHTYLNYLQARARGLYNTNALEAQLDLVYSYCQYELSQPRQNSKNPNRSPTHLTLYRGINRLEQLERMDQQLERIDRPLEQIDKPLAQNETAQQELPVLLMNNLNSFSLDPERASEFGDRVVKIQVPIQKVLCFDQLFPGLLKGEGEYLVVGGLYRVEGWVY